MPSLIFLLALLLGTPSEVLSAAEATAAFDAANQLYGQGQFSEAAQAYENIIESGAISSSLYFNLGNARFKAGDVGKAIVAFREAEKLAPRDPDLRANIAFVRNQIQGPSEQPGRVKRWLQRMTLNEWTVLTTVPFWMFMLSLAGLQFASKFRSNLRTLAWFSGAAMIVLAACLFFAWQSGSERQAVVIVDQAVVRNGPLEESQSAFTVHNGAELNVLDEKNDWLQVSVGNRIGWVKRALVETN